MILKHHNNCSRAATRTNSEKTIEKPTSPFSRFGVLAGYPDFRPSGVAKNVGKT